jgi:hypothetical protein
MFTYSLYRERETDRQTHRQRESGKVEKSERDRWTDRDNKEDNKREWTGTKTGGQAEIRMRRRLGNRGSHMKESHAEKQKGRWAIR